MEHKTTKGSRLKPEMIHLGMINPKNYHLAVHFRYGNENLKFIFKTYPFGRPG